ncbi:uncharacterized protein ARB_06728 [Trichophyton benhamiae CBS 112371]|uniref:Methyltransferase domain-containing protein n=1 Tax=Arthroderma benhamiae (strain ATCC MYA-4681 / CBS 112371) TaxID=663331 RepID=D4ARI5_ARTBC|nr:uncharacterized protein ARB_06728 [Trichophyton benhamiae CBS 112371]EFE34328.1 conserved hypothetical protein [Trichophyton benhamiae CBS 112371]
MDNGETPSRRPLPLPAEWTSADAYLDSLLSFATSSQLFKDFCGGVHILDFLIREPDLYASVIPEDWRQFFARHDILDILDLLMREDIGPFMNADEEKDMPEKRDTWRDGPVPPRSLVEYIHSIRRHALLREFTPAGEQPDIKRPVGRKGIPYHVFTGMKPKKCHEVENFAKYVASLTEDVDRIRGVSGDDATTAEQRISHIVDFGSGQNYLGRALVSPPYNRHVIAIERRHNDIASAKRKDIRAKVAEKTVVMRNKKEHRAKLKAAALDGMDTPTTCSPGEKDSTDTLVLQQDKQEESPVDTAATILLVADSGSVENGGKGEETAKSGPRGLLDYVEHEIQDGYLEPIIEHIIGTAEEVREQDEVAANGCMSSPPAAPLSSRVMVVSLHSCGNLVHHGIKSLILNPSVVAVAMIGCCYNLMTERLAPATYKLPSLRLPNSRLEQTSNACDPHGFPMSRRFEQYSHENGNGIRLNITARMMAVQAPYNWGKEDSEAFFTRHFFRALLQRVLVDYGIVPVPGRASSSSSDTARREDETQPGVTQQDTEVPGCPLIVGSLRKSAFLSFTAYARAAVAKLVHDPQYGNAIKQRVEEAYVARYESAKKNLSVVWSLMAFSASVVESMIVTDRWMYLREQECVKDAWVEPVFEYSQSPRNLVVRIGHIEQPSLLEITCTKCPSYLFSFVHIRPAAAAISGTAAHFSQPTLPGLPDPDSVRNAGGLIRGPIQVQRSAEDEVEVEGEVEVEAEVDDVEIASCDAVLEMAQKGNTDDRPSTSNNHQQRLRLAVHNKQRTTNNANTNTNDRELGPGRPTAKLS